MYLDVDAAVVVPVNILPLCDDTDGKSIEPAVVYNSAGMALVWNFVTSAGAYTATAVTPTTGGDYDWGEPVANQGMYSIEIPASGGASINNDTEGYGWFTGVATGILPWRGPTIGFRAAGINDKLCDSAYDATRGLAGTALPAAAADAAGGLAISDAGGLDLDTKLGYLQAAITSTILGRIDAAITSRSSHSAADVKTAIEVGGGSLAQIIAAVITNAAGTDIAADIIALKADLDKVPKSDGSVSLNATVLAAIGLAVLDHSLATGDADALNARTVRSALRALRNKSGVDTGTYTVCKEDDAATAWTAAVTEDAAANPITAIDPV